MTQSMIRSQRSLSAVEEAVSEPKPTDGSATKRMLWVDAAKGFSIVLVVILHSAGWFAEGKGFGHSYVLDVSRFFQPLRMPLFFSFLEC